MMFYFSTLFVLFFFLCKYSNIRFIVHNAGILRHIILQLPIIDNCRKKASGKRYTIHSHDEHMSTVSFNTCYSSCKVLFIWNFFNQKYQMYTILNKIFLYGEFEKLHILNEYSILILISPNHLWIKNNICFINFIKYVCFIAVWNFLTKMSLVAC